MTIDEKIRLALFALTAISGAVAALHFGGHLEVKNPLLEAMGGIGSSRT